MPIMRSSFPADNLLLQVDKNGPTTVKESLHSSFPKDLDCGKACLVRNYEGGSYDVARPSLRSAEHLKCKLSRKKTVAFNTIVRYREIPHLRDLPNERKLLLWETPRTLRKICKDAINIASSLNFGMEVSEESGERGLYCLLHSEKWKRTARREAIYQDIDDLQEMQLDFRMLFDKRGDITEMIGRRCAFLSEQSKLEALKRAHEDEAVVRDQYA